jgi:ABC-2 type transport system permease protein
MHYLRLLWLYVRLGAMSEMQYRANFFVQIIDSLAKIGTALGALQIVFTHTDTIGGWNAIQLRALLGVFFLVGGLINMILEPSMMRLMEDVRKGTLDFTLLKPEDAQVLVSAQQVEIWKIADVLMGFGILGVSLYQLAEPIGVRQVLLFGMTLLSGGAIVYSFWLMLATCVFWFIKITNILVIFESMYQAGRWPLGLYPYWLKTTLTFAVPVAAAVTIPAEALVGRLNNETALFAAGLAVVMLLASRWFWTVGVRHYSGASS